MVTQPLAHQVRRVAPRPDGQRLAAAVLVALVTGVLLTLALRGPLLALAISGTVAASIGAIAAPRPFRIVAFIGLSALPLLSAWAALRPEENHLIILFTAAVVGLVSLGALQPRMITGGVGTACLTYLSVAALVVMLRQPAFEGATSVAYFVMAFAIYTLARRGNPMERRLIIDLLLGMAAVQSIIAVLQAAAGWPVFPAVLPQLLESDRNYFAYVVPGLSHTVTQGSGTFVHFNHLGALLSACLPLALGRWLENKRSLWVLAALLVIACGLVATFSRGALLGAIAGGLFVLWFGPSRSRRATTALAIGFGILVTLLSVNVLTQYYESTQNATIRVQTWQTAMNDALDRPSDLVFGSGYGYFSRNVLESGLAGQALIQQSSYMSSMHSSLLQVLLEFGLVGFLLAAMWVTVALRKGLRSARHLVVPALGGIVGLLCSQAFDNALLSYAGVVFAALMAIAEAAVEDAHPSLVSYNHWTPRTGRLAAR